MRKTLSIMSAAVISVACMGGVANAETCDTIVINGTGDGSNNTVTCNVTADVNVTCTNGLYALTSNSQTAVSGAVEAEGNTAGGATITGNATNENGETVTIGASCIPAVTTTTTSTSAPTEPGMGGGSGAYIPEVLPDTSSTSPVFAVLGVIAAATGILAINRIVVAAYRKAIR